MATMSSLVSTYHSLLRSWNIERDSLPIFAEACSMDALVGLTFEGTKPLELQQQKQDGKITQVMEDDQMRGTECSKTIGTRLVCLWRLVGSLFRVSCLQDLWTIDNWLFFPLPFSWMPSRLLSEAHILKILILSFMLVWCKVSFYFRLSRAEHSLHARHSVFSLFQPLVGPSLPPPGFPNFIIVLAMLVCLAGSLKNSVCSLFHFRTLIVFFESYFLIPKITKMGTISIPDAKESQWRQISKVF